MVAPEHEVGGGGAGESQVETVIAGPPVDPVDRFRDLPLPAWEPRLQPVAKELATRIFRSKIPPDCADPEVLKDVYGKINSLIATEVPPELRSEKALPAMIKLNFLRLVKFRSRIPLSDERIRSTLSTSPSAAD